MKAMVTFQSLLLIHSKSVSYIQECYVSLIYMSMFLLTESCRLYMHFNLPYHKGHKSLLNGGPLHTQHWGPMAIALPAHSLVEKMELVQVHLTPTSRDHRSKWMQGGCKVYMDSYMASNGSCVMITWIIFKNHLLEVGLTQNMVFQHLTTIDSLYLIMCEDPTWTFRVWLRVSHIWLHTTLEGMWSHYVILELPWDTLWTLLLGSHNLMVTALGLCVKWPLHPWQVQNIPY